MPDTQTLAYRYRLLPTRSQHKALRTILEDQRQLYNAALQERTDSYAKTGRGRSYVDQCRALTECRRGIEGMASLPANLQRGTLRRLDIAFRGFFARRKEGVKAGYPRYRGEGWFDSFDFNEFTGIKFDGTRLRFAGLPSSMRVHMHRPMPKGKILRASFKRDAKGWAVAFVVNVPVQNKRVVTSACGVDVGIKTLAATSDGLLIPNPRPARRALRELRRLKRQLCRAKKGSKRRLKTRLRVRRFYKKTVNTRATALHRASALLVKRYDLIAIEALNNQALARGKLSLDIYDAGWGMFRRFLHYKAERAGVHIVEVAPHFTSQDCPQCGRRERKTLDQRVHSCPCGCVLDRDVAAARVILSRADVCPGALNVAECSERALGNLTLTDRR